MLAKQRSPFAAVALLVLDRAVRRGATVSPLGDSDASRVGDPVFVVGGGSFIAELLDVAGADNLGARFPDPYPRIAVEWLVDQAPEVVIDVTTDAGDPMVFWSRWPTMPAVANGRVLRLDPQAVTLPGPALDESIELLVAALHGPATAARLASLESKAAAVSSAASARWSAMTE